MNTHTQQKIDRQFDLITSAITSFDYYLKTVPEDDAESLQWISSKLYGIIADLQSYETLIKSGLARHAAARTSTQPKQQSKESSHGQGSSQKSGAGGSVRSKSKEQKHGKKTP